MHDPHGGDEAARAKLDELTENATPLSVSALPVTEVSVGLRDGEIERFDRVIDRTNVVPLGHEEARCAARIQRGLKREGRGIGAIDAMIAATAIERNEPVVTRNVSEFDRVPDCTISPY